MVAVPVFNPETLPVAASIVAISVLALVHFPPDAEPVRVRLYPVHTVAGSGEILGVAGNPMLMV